MGTLVVVSLYHLFPRFQIWHFHTSTKYRWAQKQNSRNWWRLYVAGDWSATGIATHTLTFSQCYQWFACRLNDLMDTHPSSSAGKSTDASHAAGNWSSNGRFIFNPNAFSLTQQRDLKGEESTVLDSRASIQIWIWWWTNFDQNCIGQTRLRSPSTDQGRWPLCILRPFALKLSEELCNRSSTVAQCGCRQEVWAAESWNFAQSCLLTSMLPCRWDAYRKEGHCEDDTPTGKEHIPTGKVHRLSPENPSPWSNLQVAWAIEAEATKKLPKFAQICFLKQEWEIPVITGLQHELWHRYHCTDAIWA